jgi:hypothetical protein
VTFKLCAYNVTWLNSPLHQSPSSTFPSLDNFNRFHFIVWYSYKYTKFIHHSCSLHLLHFLSSYLHWYPLPDRNCFTFLFIFKVYTDWWGGFALVFHICIYCTLVRLTPCIAHSFSTTLFPYYPTAISWVSPSWNFYLYVFTPVHNSLGSLEYRAWLCSLHLHKASKSGKYFEWKANGTFSKDLSLPRDFSSK